MKIFTPKAHFKGLFLSTIVLTLAACSSSNNNDEVTVTQQYSVRITNLTNAQPLSPPVAMLHDSSFSFWKIGDAASVALEMMAEGGDGSALLALASTNPQHQSTAPIGPGASDEFMLETDDATLNLLSVAGMLVNTNDAFSGLNSIELSALTSGQTSVFLTHAYDSGTEVNSELAGTMPGPADGGEGFNAERLDVTGVVTLHGGVVTADDNLVGSALSEAEKFDNPTLRIEVTAL